MRILAFILTLLLAPTFATAQSGSYSTWQNPDASTSSAASNEKLQEFVTRLNALVDKAEEARAADPTFLRDLRDLATGFNRPWRTLVFDDAFQDGNFTANPTWQVTAGEYWIEKGWGLRSAIDPKAVAASANKTLTGKDAAAAIFGQILNQAISGKQQNQGGQPSTPSEAVIHATTTISNAFSINVNMGVYAGQGRLELAVYQGNFAGSKRSGGYRLVYLPQGVLELHRVSSRGTAIIDSTRKIPALQDKKFHQLEWLRHADGRMSISIDGNALLNATDRGFRDAFTGLAIINGGGDYIFKRVTVNGT